MNHQQIIDLPRIFHEHGVRHAVISPGSRNALISVSFHRFPAIQSLVIPDERSAGNIALGIAQATNTPVVVICTSGSAVYQYGGAVSEAFFLNVPLIVLSADRPDEWIDQLDGQTIRQKDVFKDHTKARCHLPADTSHPDAAWHFTRTVNEILITCQTSPKGPVHINLPVREPFYESLQNLLPSDLPHIIKKDQHSDIKKPLPKAFLTDWETYSKKMLIIGQKTDWTQKELDKIRELSRHCAVVADNIANCPVEGTIRHQDLFLNTQQAENALKPNMLITLGKSVLSKSLKKFIRKNPPVRHWHFDEENHVQDPFQTITHWHCTDSTSLFEELPVEKPANNEFLRQWKELDKNTADLLELYFSQKTYNSLSIVNTIMQSMENNEVLHLANSMTVRYANFINPLHIQKTYCNRGTSGLDTSNGTAVGHAIAHPDQRHILISGDIAFMYDSNAFWNNYLGHNLTVFVLNDGGGGIFEIIDGPAKVPENKEVFTSPYTRNLKHVAQLHGFEYYQITNLNELEEYMTSGYTSHPRAVVDIVLDMEKNTMSFKKFKKALADKLTT